MEWLWDRHLLSQKKYDPYFDEWDLHIQFDSNAQHPNHDNEDDEDDEWETMPLISIRSI